MPNEQKRSDELKYSLYIEHGKQYTELLKHYIESVRDSNNLKLVLKGLFFSIIILIMIGLTIIFGISVYSSFEIIKELEYIDESKTNSVEYIIGAVTSLIPSLATMLVSLIKLPEIIAKYLFNKKEDEHMTQIIANIQNYDVQIYSIEQEAKAFVKKQQNGKDPKEFPNRNLPGNAEEPSDDTNPNEDHENPPDDSTGQ